MRMLVGIAWKETRTLPNLTALEIAVAPSVAQFNSNSYLKGGPAWLDSDHFDVIAKAPTGTPEDTVRLMVQKLLAERFHQLPDFAPRFFEGRPVADATGLSGGWDFRLDWTPGESCVRYRHDDLQHNGKEPGDQAGKTRAIDAHHRHRSGGSDPN